MGDQRLKTFISSPIHRGPPLRGVVFSLLMGIISSVFLGCGPSTLGSAEVKAKQTLAAAQANATVVGSQMTVAARSTASSREVQDRLATLEAQRKFAEQQLEQAREQERIHNEGTREAISASVYQTRAILQITLQAIPPQQTVAAGTAQAVAAEAMATATVNTSQIMAAQAIISKTAEAEIARQEWSTRTQIIWTCANGLVVYILPTLLVVTLIYGFMRIVKAYEIHKRVVTDSEGNILGVITLPTVRGQDPIIRITNPLGEEVRSLEAPEAAEETLSALPHNPGPLEFTSIPGPLMLPIGVTLTQPDGLWISLVEGDSFLIAGARRKGKTNLLKTWIQSLVISRSGRLVMYDGKSGVEFGQYRQVPRCLVVEDHGLMPTLEEIQKEMRTRIEVFKSHSVSSVVQYNQRVGGMDRLIIIVDELAFALQEEGVEDALVDLIARGGAFGIHPILATQRPSVDVITPQIKANLSTRIALPVASSVDSRVILDRGGAEKLPKVPGRLLLLWEAQVIEAQAWLAPEDLPVGIRRGTRQLVKREVILNEVELAMAQAAIENNGRFAIDRVHGILRAKGIVIARQIVGKTAQEWQSRGWLTQEQRKENGQSDSRHVTDELRRLVGLQSSIALRDVSLAQVPPLAA